MDTDLAPHGPTLERVQRIIDLHAAWGRPDQVLRWQQELDARENNLERNDDTKSAAANRASSQP